MAVAPTEIKGVVHGKTIELDRESGLPDGQAVTVIVRPIEAPAGRLAPGEGIRRSAGGWAEDADELDRYLEWNRQRRKLAGREIPE